MSKRQIDVVLRDLYAGLRQRPYPTTVAQRIRGMLWLTPDQTRLLPVTPGRMAGGLMPVEWASVAGLTHQVTVLATLLDQPVPDGHDVDAIRALIDHARVVIGKEAGRSDFRADRINLAIRRERGITMSRRRYDKLFRLTARIETYLDELISQTALSGLTRFAKVGMAHEITWEDFAASPNSAAFVAYMTANLSRRSLFTVGRQARAFDAAAAMLLERCWDDPTANWYAIAHVYPHADVMGRLTAEQLGTLMGRSFAVMRETADRLYAIYAAAPAGTLDIAGMVVGRGNDSSTWNALAGAWNKARDLWFASGWALDGDGSFAEAFCPGKVLRLMAADVVRWHRSTGGGLDPDTAVWADLPRPWAVMRGESDCTWGFVVGACARHGVDAAASGWVRPRPRTMVDVVMHTPDAVHGVVVGNPELAAVLRRAGWFSGHAARHTVDDDTALAGIAARDTHWREQEAMAGVGTDNVFDEYPV